MKKNQALLDEITRIKVNVLQKSSHSLKSIMVTCANRGEGASTVAYYLALALAIEKKNRILLIDSNIRHASLHARFDHKQENGFSDFLKGEANLTEIIKETSFVNIKLITAGEISHKKNQLDILSNITQEEIKKTVEKDFDWVIYDSSAVNCYPDTLLLTPLTDGIVLVIFAEKTRRAEVIKVKDSLEFINGNILGGVLNGRRYVIPEFIYKRL